MQEQYIIWLGTHKESIGIHKVKKNDFWIIRFYFFMIQPFTPRMSDGEWQLVGPKKENRYYHPSKDQYGNKLFLINGHLELSRFVEDTFLYNSILVEDIARYILHNYAKHMWYLYKNVFDSDDFCKTYMNEIWDLSSRTIKGKQRLYKNWKNTMHYSQQEYGKYFGEVVDYMILVKAKIVYDVIRAILENDHDLVIGELVLPENDKLLSSYHGLYSNLIDHYRTRVTNFIYSTIKFRNIKSIVDEYIRFDKFMRNMMRIHVREKICVHIECMPGGIQMQAAMEHYNSHYQDRTSDIFREE